MTRQKCKSMVCSGGGRWFGRVGMLEALEGLRLEVVTAEVVRIRSDGL